MRYNLENVCSHHPREQLVNQVQHQSSSQLRTIAQRLTSWLLAVLMCLKITGEQAQPDKTCSWGALKPLSAQIAWLECGLDTLPRLILWRSYPLCLNTTLTLGHVLSLLPPSSPLPPAPIKLNYNTISWNANPCCSHINLPWLVANEKPACAHYWSKCSLF